jgi:hypothetical protein
MSTGRAALAEPMWREHHEARECDEKVAFWLNTAASARLLEVAPEKVVSRDFILALTASQLELFVDVSLMADGHRRWLAQKDPRRVEAFELACILLGRTPHTYKISSGMTMTHESRSQGTTVSRSPSGRGPRVSETRYTGTVWCPTTRNGTWLARRNGAVFYTGNSISADGGSSPELNGVFDGIFAGAGRWPALILSGHVHDYQRFTRREAMTEAGVAPTITYVVCGNGGYHNLHAIAGDYTPGMQVADGITCDFADGTNWGFLDITVSAGKISGEYVQVAKDGTVTPNADTFTAR